MEPLHLRRLSPEHADLLDTFVCSTTASEPLIEFLQERALPEQAAHLNATFILLSNDELRIDAYVTLSIANWELSQSIRKERGIDRKTVPSVMIGYVAVSDERRKQKDKVGKRIFDRVKAEAFQMNAYVGIRLVTLEVEAKNWTAYQIYRRDWEMDAVPLKIGEKVYKPPPPEYAKTPDHIPPDYRIQMFYDLLPVYGSYWPRPAGLPAHQALG